MTTARIVAGVLLGACGVVFFVMGVALLFGDGASWGQRAFATLVCVGPGLVMAESGVRITLRRPRRGGAYVHPAVRVLLGGAFMGIGIYGLAKGVLTHSAWNVFGGVSYIGAGSLIVRGRLLGAEEAPRSSREA